MEVLVYLKEQLHIDLFIVLLVFAAGFFQQRYLYNLKWSQALRTLAVSFVFSAVYLILLSIAGQFKKENIVQYFISYAVATSFYELLIKPFKTHFQNAFPKN